MLWPRFGTSALIQAFRTTSWLLSIGAVFFPRQYMVSICSYALFALAFYGGLRYLGEGHVAQFKLTPQELGIHALFNGEFVLVLGVIMIYRMTSDRLRETISRYFRLKNRSWCAICRLR